MQTTVFIEDCLKGVQIRLRGSCDGLTREHAVWRPTPRSNNIGFILWHVARAEDSMVGEISGEIHLWASDSWHERFGQPEDAPDPGDRMGLRSLKIPEMEVLTAYLEAVHNRTLAYLGSMEEADLPVAPDPAQPHRTRAAILRHMITHKNHHQGQIDFIRGLQDDVWDLPPGTGIDLTP